MTILPDINARNNLHIDTLKKAFVWSALALHKVCRTSLNTDFNDWVKYNHKLTNKENGVIKPVLFVEIKLPYNSGLFVSNGGNLHLALQEISQGAVAPSMPFSVAATPSLPIEPLWVDTLERYCLWTAYELTKQSLGLIDGNFDLNLIDLVNNQAYAQISAEMFFDFNVFLSNKSYVDSIGINTAVVPNGLGNLGTLSNSGTLGN